MTTLGEVRATFPTWQDDGQTGEDDSLDDDLVVIVHANGAVSVAASGAELAPPLGPDAPAEDHEAVRRLRIDAEDA